MTVELKFHRQCDRFKFLTQVLYIVHSSGSGVATLKQRCLHPPQLSGQKLATPMKVSTAGQYSSPPYFLTLTPVYPAFAV